MLNIISMGVWSLQGIMAIVVVCLSVDLVKGQVIGDAPTTTKYGTFTGGFGLSVAVLGLVSVFIDAIPALVIMAADALSGLLLFGGGIAFAIGLHGVTCEPTTQKALEKLLDNELSNRGKVEEGNDIRYGIGNDVGLLSTTCKKATADQAMQFVTFGFAMATIGLVFLAWKKNHGSRGGAYA